MPDQANARFDAAAQPTSAPLPMLAPSPSALEEAVKARYANGTRDFALSKLSGARLAGVDLRDACFDGADLSGADLSGADLRGASFRGALLSFARLEGANVMGATFANAALVSATLAEVKGLSAGALAGADLRGSVVPEPVLRFESLGNANDAASTTASLFFALISACTYSILTVAGTSDAQLMLNSVSSNLPVLGAPIQLGPFYVVAPLLLLALFLYFQLNLQRLWEHLAELPAVFPDGTPIHRRATSWIFNLVPALYSPHLIESRPPLFWGQLALLGVLGWGAAPITVLVLWQRFLHKHASGATLAILLLLALTLGAAVLFGQLCAATLRVRGTPSQIRSHLARDPVLYVGLAMALIVVGLAGKSTAEALHGERPAGLTSSYRLEREAHPETREVTSRLWFALFPPPVAMLAQADLSNRSGASKEDLSDVKGAELSYENLRYARAYGAYLVRGNLVGADLTGAELALANARLANFEGAVLSEADVQGADLTGAMLDFVHLERAELSKAKLAAAHLREADLSGANLSGAFLPRADLSGARLDGAELRGADLSTARGLTRAQLEKAHVDGATQLPPDLLGAAQTDRPKTP